MSSLFNYILLNFPHFQDIHSLIIITALGIIAAGICIGFIIFVSICISWADRKIATIIQRRVTPSYRRSRNQWLQTFKDGLKLLFKQDIMSFSSDKTLFHLVPFLVFVPISTVFAIIPFSDILFISTLNTGLLYILSALTLSALGLVMAGLAPDSKWSLYGALREIALIISYIIPLGLSLIPIIMVTGSLDLQEFIRTQNGGIQNWFILKHFPFNLISFVTYFITSFALIHRNPFKTSEENSEITNGIYTEYSGIRLGLLYLTKHTSMFILSAVSVILFWGGWQSPVSFNTGIPDILWFLIKTGFLILLQLWIHWSLPKMRIDQILYLFWKVMIPVSLLTVIGSAMLMVVNEL